MIPMNKDKVRKLAKKGKGLYEKYQPMHPRAMGVKDDEPWWRDLTEMLQAQVLVQLDSGRPTKKNPQLREAERLLFACTPYIRKRTVFILMVLWLLTTLVPAMLLVEYVDEIGSYISLIWAAFSCFLYGPRISRSSREVFALTTKRAFISKRSMYCSIHTGAVNYDEMRQASLQTHKDGTGTFTFVQVGRMYAHPKRITFDRIRDVKGCVRVLAEVLPEEVARDAGFVTDAPDDSVSRPAIVPPRFNKEESRFNRDDDL